VLKENTSMLTEEIRLKICTSESQKYTFFNLEDFGMLKLNKLLKDDVKASRLEPLASMFDDTSLSPYSRYHYSSLKSGGGCMRRRGHCYMYIALVQILDTLLRG